MNQQSIRVSTHTRHLDYWLFFHNKRILTNMKKFIVTIVLLMAAIYFYSVGLAMPAAGFLVLGALAELTAWGRYVKWPRWNRATK